MNKKKQIEILRSEFGQLSLQQLSLKARVRDVERLMGQREGKIQLLEELIKEEEEKGETK